MNKETEDIKKYLCRLPFAWGKGDSIREAWDNAFQEYSLSPENLQWKHVEIFEGYDLAIDGMETVTGQELRQLKPEEYALFIADLFQPCSNKLETRFDGLAGTIEDFLLEIRDRKGDTLYGILSTALADAEKILKLNDPKAAKAKREIEQ